jgi:hypothetical protein
MPRSANAQGDGIDGITRSTLPLDPRIGWQGTSPGLSAERKTLGHVDGRTRPGPGFTRQVTTATPGRLDFMGEQARR